MDHLLHQPNLAVVTAVDTSIDCGRLREMEEMECGHYVGHGYVSNWGMQCSNMRRRRCASNAPPSTAVSGYRRYLKRTEPEMKRTRRVGNDKSYASEQNGSIRKIQLLMKNKYGKMTHNC